MDAVGSKFADSKQIVASIFFLRFICKKAIYSIPPFLSYFFPPPMFLTISLVGPTILSPVHYGLVQEGELDLSKDVVRGLVVITKLLQRAGIDILDRLMK